MKFHSLILSLFLFSSPCFSQVISNNGSVVTITTGINVHAGTLSNAAGTLTNNGTLTLTANCTNSSTLVSNGNLNIGGNFSNSATFTPGTGTVTFNGTTAQSISGSSACTFYNLNNSNTTAILTANFPVTVDNILTLNASSIFDMGTNALSGTLASTSGTGTFKTQNTSAAPIPSGKTWVGSVFYNSSSAQTIVLGNYNNINGTGGNRTFLPGTTGISGTFTVGSGTYTNTGSTIDFNGTSSQTIPAFTFNNVTLSGGNTKTCGGNINVTNALTLGANTTLALSSSNVTLKSSATSTGRVATIPATASITYGTGRFIVERYIPGRRKYRLITSSVTTSASSTLTSGQEVLSIWGNWQTSGANTAGHGNIITGGTSADGFDQQTTTASVYTYDDVNRKFVGFTSANGKNTKYTPLKAGVPYYMFVYGDRTNSIITSTPGNTTISATGTLLTGDQTYTTTSSLPLSAVTGRFTMIGNPFASPIDWGTVVKTNIASTYWGWDPNLSSTGGYMTVTSTGTATLISPYSGTVGLNQYIQPGQGFFVQTTAASPQVVIREQDKVSNFNANAFRKRGANDVPLIAINLLYDNAGTKVLADGVLAAFDSTFENSVGREDAGKMSNSGENISIVNGGDFLSIDARKLPQPKDTLFLSVARLTKPKYTLQVFVKQMENQAQPYLFDTHLGTSKLLSITDTNYIDFNIDAAKLSSFDAKRFKIVFGEAQVSPILFLSVKATLKNKDALVEWSVKEDSTVKKYLVEYSTDNISFTNKTEITAKGSNTLQAYQWSHANLTHNTNYYRIRSIHNDGRYYVSKSVLVKLDLPVTEIKVYPNPVKNQIINLKLNNLEQGEYSFQLFNANGSEVANKSVSHMGGSSSQQFRIPVKVPNGLYYILIRSKANKFTLPVLVQD